MEQNMKTNFTRHFFIDLAKECGLNTTIFEQLGSRRDTEIVVDNDTLEMLVKLQEQFARLEEMGDDEYRGFYIEFPPPARLRKNGEIAKRRLQTENMRARKNTSGIENCQIPGKWHGIMSAPPGTKKSGPYNSRTGNTRILLLRIILDI
nr:hypothetical protein [uncultured Alistipes sp.]